MGPRPDWQQLSYASLVVTAAWIFMAVRARHEYQRAFRRSIEGRAMALATVRPDAADSATIETLVEELANPDESCVLYAIDMLEAFDKRNLITPLLLHHESPGVRARALVALGSARPAVAGRWTPAVERMLEGRERRRQSRGRPRAGGVAQGGRVHADAASSDRHRTPRGGDRSGGPERLGRRGRRGRGRSHPAADDRGHADAAAGARKEAAAALGRITNERFRSLLVPLIADRDVDVAREAIRSVQRLSAARGAIDALFVPGLVALLGHRKLKPAARAVLASHGEDVLATLVHFLKDRKEHVWVRRHIPATLALSRPSGPWPHCSASSMIPTGSSASRSRPRSRRLHHDHPELAVPRTAIEPLVLKEGRATTTA